MKVEEGHRFPPIPIYNPFNANAPLRRLLARLFSETDHLDAIFYHLESLGNRCITQHAASAAKLQGIEAEPKLTQYDAWGRRVDELRTSEGWRELKAATAVEGIVAESYPQQPMEIRSQGFMGRDLLGPYARVYAFAKIQLFGPFSKLVLCPVSMTDGATRVLELAGTIEQRKLLTLLTNGDPRRSWMAGQWMTEKAGGSDISGTETRATPVCERTDGSTYQAGDAFVLDGFKWFSSATDGDIALALARTNPDMTPSPKGLSLFLLRIRSPTTGQLNGIRVHRLKKKLGTRYLPTAELELDNCKAELVGGLGEGVKIVSSVLNITRLYSAAGGVFSLTAGLQKSTSFALTRQVGSLPLSSYPLHTQSLFRLTVLQRGLQQLFFFNVVLLGRSEAGVASKSDLALLRLYTPALKAYTAIRASEGVLGLLDSFGGQGYMEDSGLGVSESLRDISVERIWEGTIEVMGMDMVRVLVQSKGEVFGILFGDLKERLAAMHKASGKVGLEKTLQELNQQIDALESVVKLLVPTLLDADLSKSLDYRFALPLLEIVMSLNGSVLLLEQAQWTAQAHTDRLNQKVDLSSEVAEEEAAIAMAWVRDVGETSKCMREFEELVRQREGRAAMVALQERVVFRDAKRMATIDAKL